MSTPTKHAEVYAKQVDVAREFGVTEATVHNWIKAAEAGNNNLNLRKREGKNYIVNNKHNIAEMYRLERTGRKYASNMSEMVVQVNEEGLISELGKQNLTRLINSLLTNNEIPNKMTYMGHGSQIWSEFYNETAHEDSKYYTTSSSADSLEKLMPVLEGYIKKFKKVNIIDIGCGDGRPLIHLTEKLNTKKKVLNYVAVDISQGMINLAKDNLLRFVPGLVFREELLDFETESLQDVMYELKEGRNDICNLLFMVGGTLGNYGDQYRQVRVLQNIKDGMDISDLLVVSNDLDIIKNRTDFPALQNMKAPNDLILNLSRVMGLDDYMFTRQLQYNEKTELKEYNIILKYNTKFIFDSYGITIDMKAGEAINLWKHRQDTFELIASKVKDAKMGLKTIYLHDTVPTITYVVGSSTDIL